MQELHVSPESRTTFISGAFNDNRGGSSPWVCAAATSTSSRGSLLGTYRIGVNSSSSSRVFLGLPSAPLAVAGYVLRCGSSSQLRQLHAVAADSDNPLDLNPSETQQPVEILLDRPWADLDMMPARATEGPEGPKYLCIYVGGMTAAMHARAAAKLRGISVKQLAATWKMMEQPEWAWKEVPSADNWIKMLLSRYTYQGRSQRKGFQKEATLVGFQEKTLPLFSNNIKRGWQTFGDVPAVESQFLSDTLKAWEVNTVVVSKVRRWPSRSEVRELFKVLHVGREIKGHADAFWVDAESSHTAAGPILWEGKEYSSGIFRSVVFDE